MDGPGGGSPSLPPFHPPKLRAFAKAGRRAHAEARIGAEIRVYKDRPAQWLTYAARSKPNRDGWTKPAEGTEEDGAPKPPTMEETLARLAQQEEAARRLE